MSEQVEILVAASEHSTAMKAIADKISNLPEKYGCDAIWRAQGKWWGVQRKEIWDFIASTTDGRLAKEIGQMRGHVSNPIVVIEGKTQWSIGGELMGNGYSQTITKRQWHGMIFSMTNDGVNVLFSDSTRGTAEIITDLAAWSQKDSHRSLKQRPGPVPAWGKADNKDWAMHLLQGFPGIGPGVAETIVKKFGKVPLKWDCTLKDLLSIEGIGPARAKALMEAFNEV